MKEWAATKAKANAMVATATTEAAGNVKAAAAAEAAAALELVPIHGLSPPLFVSLFVS